MNYPKFDINHTVRVKLTPEGRAVHAADHAMYVMREQNLPPALRRYTPPQEDMDGWSYWQLWGLMRAFGKHITLNGPLMFHPEIELIGDRSNLQRTWVPKA